MIRIQQLTLMRGVKTLFDKIELTLNPGEKIGLTGANGAGKSSLFSLFLQEIHPDGGDLDFPRTWRVAHVAQETPALARTALDYVIDGDNKLRATEAELAQLEEQAYADNTDSSLADQLGERIAGLHVTLADLDAYTAPSRAERLLNGLGFRQADFDKPVATFSGGWRMRLNLAQALMCPSDLLLLDEPTNHLDLDAIIWLEEWLKRYPGTLLIISHDRDFLDNVTNVIVHIEHQSVKRYGGNYSAFERQRAAQQELQASLIEKQQRQRAHLQSFIDRFKAKATKARQAQSRVKALSRLEEIAPLRGATAFSFEFREPANAPDPLLVMDKVDAGYRSADSAVPDAVIVKNITFSLQSGQRIGLLGVNGAGKSTFIKTIAGDIDPLNGTMQLGKGLLIGYFAQHQIDMLRHDDSPLQHLVRLAPTTREQELRNFLGSFRFDGAMATGPVGPMSGGEKSRLAMALIVWQRPNLLLLDEPTNHLDIETREALTMALAQFEGTVILVSHDRHLLRATADRFLIVADQQAREFDGDLDDYRQWLLQTRAAEASDDKAAKANNSPVAAAPKIVAAPPEKLDSKARHEQQRRIQAQRKPLENAIRKFETQIETMQARLAELEIELGDSNLYDMSRKDDLTLRLNERSNLTAQLEAIEEQWLEKQQELDDLENAS